MQIKKKWGRKKSKKIVVVQEKETKQENVENNWCIFEIKTMLENKKKIKDAKTKGKRKRKDLEKKNIYIEWKT